MNKTQELITNSYTIGHALNTLIHIQENTEQQIKLFKKEKMSDSDMYIKLIKINAQLEPLLKHCQSVRETIENIDS